MMVSPLVSDGSRTSSSARSVGSDLTGPSQGYDDVGTKRQKLGGARGSSFSSRFRDDLARAANAIKPAPFYSSKLCPNKQQIEELFGPDFSALVPPGKPPCMNFFIFGECSYQSCFNQHALTKEPSKHIIDGIASRLKTRVNAFVANPKA
jgi:hypothetical protein